MATLGEFFGAWTLSRRLFDVVQAEVEALGDVTMHVTKSQIAFSRQRFAGRERGFAWAWVPERYLRRGAAPLVLSVALPWRDTSIRWKQVVEPAPGRFLHHLELYETDDVDDDVRAWLRRAWEAAA